MNGKYEPAIAGDLSSKPEELWAQYYLYFDANYQSGSNLYKLPGMSDLNGNPPASGPPECDGSNYRWVAYGTFTDAGSGTVDVGHYVYHLDQSNPDYADGYIADTISLGEWHRIDQHIKVNSFSGSGGSLSDANSDGVMQMWVDGTLQIDEQGMRFRCDDQLAVQQFNHLFYHGGNDTSPQDQFMAMDGWKVGTNNFAGL
jgi:hypothetical protein